MAEAKWFGAPLLLVTASWFVDYTVLAVAVLLCTTIWLLLHLAGVTVHGSFRLERGCRSSSAHSPGGAGRLVFVYQLVVEGAEPALVATERGVSRVVLLEQLRDAVHERPG